MVIDSAPTGHALRLLEMPGLAHDWVKALMAILLKYQSIVGVGGLGEVLLRLSQGLRRLRELLTDPARTTFVAVTRPAALPHAETLRLVRRLRAASISVPAVVVNAMGTGTCTRCAREARVQQRQLATLARELDSRRDRAVGRRRARLDAGACGRRRFAPVCSTVAPAASRRLQFAGADRARRSGRAIITAGFMATATYLYCLVQSARKPSVARVPRGLPGATPAVPAELAARLWVVHSDVPLDQYGPGPLEASLKDLDWVSRIALAHEAVVEHFTALPGATVIPMKLFTMFSSVERAVAEMRGRRAELKRVFSRLEGCEEWGVRVLRERAAAASDGSREAFDRHRVPRREEAGARRRADGDVGGGDRRRCRVRVTRRHRGRASPPHERSAGRGRSAARRGVPRADAAARTVQVGGAEGCAARCRKPERR